MIRPEHISMSFANGGPPSSLKRSLIYFLNDEETKLIYLVGRQVVIEKLTTESETNNPSYIKKSKFEFLQFGDLVTRSLLKHSGYEYKQFWFDKNSRKGFLNIKITDEKFKRFPKIIVFDLNDQKTTKVEFSDIRGDYFRCVRFTPSRVGCMFIALTKSKPQSLVFYDLNLMRLLGTATVTGDENWKEVYNCPTDGFLCLLASKTRKEIGIVRINDSISVKEINLRYSLKTGVGIIEWISEDMFAVADSCKFSVALVQHQKKAKFTVVQKIESLQCPSLPENLTLNSSIIIMKRFSKGLVIGTSGSLLLVYHLKIETAEEPKIINGIPLLILFSCVKLDGCDNLLLHSLDFSVNELDLLVVFERNTYCHFPTEEFLKGKILDARKSNHQPRLQEVDVSMKLNVKEHKPCLEMTTGEYSSNIISLAEDTHSLDIINPLAGENNFQYVFDMQTENSQIQVIEVHPTGHFVVCSMKDRLCSFNIAFKSILPIVENLRIKGAYFLRFSDMGGLLAVACINSKSNVHPICLVNPYSLELLKSVNTNSHNNTIGSMLFSSLSTLLWSSSVDGYLFMWSIPQLKKTEVYIEKEYKFMSMDIFQSVNSQNNENNSFLSLLCEDNKGGQSIVSQFTEKTEKRQSVKLSNINEHGIAIKYTCVKCLQVPDRCSSLLLGTNNGQVHFYSNATSLTMPTFVIQTSCAADISRIFFSRFNNSLTVFSREGLLNIFKLKLGQGISKEQTLFELGEDNISYSDEQSLILVKPNTLTKYEQTEKRNAQELQDLLSKFEFKLKEEKMNSEEVEIKLKHVHELEMQSKNEIIEQLQKAKEKLELESTEMVKTVENHNLLAVEELEKLYEFKIQHESDRFIQQEKVKRIEMGKLEEKIIMLNEEQKIKVERTEEKYKTQIVSASSKLQNIESEVQSLSRKHEEQIFELQTENDLIVMQIKDKYLAKIKKLDEEAKSLRKDIKEFKRFNEELSLRNENLQKESTRVNEKRLFFENQISELEKTVRKAVEENSELRESILVKEKSFNCLKKTIDELEKTKNVLTFRTAEMRKGMEPKEVQIDRLKDEVLRLENELEIVLKRGLEKDTVLAKKQDEAKSAQVNLQKLNYVISEKELWIKNISGVITNCVQRTEPKMWHVQMKRIYHFVLETTRQQEGSLKSPMLHKDIVVQVDEMNNQIHHLQTKIVQQTKMKMKSSAYQLKHIETKTEENATLLSELNDLRIGYKKLTSIKTSLGITNGQLMRENKTLNAELKGLRTVTFEGPPVIESSVDCNKENRSQTLPNFKIKSLNKNKLDTASFILQELIEDEETRLGFFEKHSNNEKLAILNHLIRFVPKNYKFEIIN